MSLPIDKLLYHLRRVSENSDLCTEAADAIERLLAAANVADRRAAHFKSMPDFQSNEWALAHFAEAITIAHLIRQPADYDAIIKAAILATADERARCLAAENITSETMDFVMRSDRPSNNAR